jgi:CspA family cold shock protein
VRNIERPTTKKEVRNVSDSADRNNSGTVKWFSDQKGYGFIARDDDADVFVHHSAIKMDGFRTLRQGEDVVYELKDGAKGPQAVNVSKPETTEAQ